MRSIIKKIVFKLTSSEKKNVLAVWKWLIRIFEKFCVTKKDNNDFLGKERKFLKQFN